MQLPAGFIESLKRLSALAASYSTRKEAVDLLLNLRESPDEDYGTDTGPTRYGQYNLYINISWVILFFVTLLIKGMYLLYKKTRRRRNSTPASTETADQELADFYLRHRDDQKVSDQRDESESKNGIKNENPV